MNPIPKKNAAGQIHCDNGPAIEDGCVRMYYTNGVLNRTDGPSVEFPNSPEDNVYHIDGVSITASCEPDLAKRVVEAPASLTSEEILGIENQEVRRIAIERHGIENFIKKVNSSSLNYVDNDVEGTKEALISILESVYFCGACPSTGRVYYIEVPKDIKSCDEARKFMSSGKDLNMCVGGS